MTAIVANPETVDGLLAYYEQDLLSIRHPLTGAPLELPGDRATRASILSLALYDPEVALVWGGDLAYSQLELYRPYLARSRRRFAIFCKSLKGRPQKATGLARTPAFALTKEFPLNKFAAAARSLKTMIYISDKQENFHYMRHQPQLVHVFGGHGDSDKHSSASPLAIAFDFIMTADANAAQRYFQAGVAINPDRIVPIGGLAIDGVTVATEFREPANILYAPTWEGHSEGVNFSSLAFVAPLLAGEAGRRDRAFRFRPHPGTGGRSPAFDKCKATLLERFEKGGAKADAFNWSDVLITDISGILSEYLFTQKPIIVPLASRDGWQARYLASTGLCDYVYAWYCNEMPLDGALALAREDRLRGARLERRDALYYGARNTDDLVALFEQALGYFETAHRLKMMRSSHRPENAPAGFGNPGGALQDAVDRLRRGELILA